MLSRRSFQTLYTIAWKIAAMQIASSTRVHTSQMRNSSVGYLGLGRTSHQILLASGMLPVRTITSTKCLNSAYEPKLRGMPVRGKLRKMMLRYDIRPVSRPIQNGEELESAITCGRK